MNVLETEAFGAPKIKGTVAFSDDVHSSMATRQKIYGSSGALAIVAGIIGGALFGFGMMLVRRARRLEEMLGLGKEKASPPPALEDVRSQPLEFEKIIRNTHIFPREADIFVGTLRSLPLKQRICWFALRT
ncbi:MAG TPA: hypothetical protein PLQ71_17745, partial [Nitrospira sp.]|nr:hypothetical protein [Nitrospira sp.]